MWDKIWWCHRSKQCTYVFLRKNSKTWLTYIAQWVYFNLIHWIQLCDKKNLTFVDCWDKILLNSSWKNVIKLAKGLLSNIYRTHLTTFYQQLTHDISDISHTHLICIEMDISLIWSTNKIFSFLVSAPKWKLSRWKEDILTQLKITFL